MAYTCSPIQFNSSYTVRQLLWLHKYPNSLDKVSLNAHKTNLRCLYTLNISFFYILVCHNMKIFVSTDMHDLLKRLVPAQKIAMKHNFGSVNFYFFFQSFYPKLQIFCLYSIYKYTRTIYLSKPTSLSYVKLERC